MTEVFDKDRRRVAILENAYNVEEVQKLNSIWYLYFTLPVDDDKNQFCNPLWYVRHNNGELYRIMPSTLKVEETGGITYQCEHVLATLIDNVLFGYHVVGNIGTYTSQVINYVLGHQLVKNWVLASCDYRNQFEYGWEQETLLSALFSIATPLAGKYMWVTDTSVYPWRLSLKKLDTTGVPELYVRRRHNMTAYERKSDPQKIVTRLYPLGYGEGVNQLDIKSVNGGVPYLQSPHGIVDKYGIVERVWTDRRYEDADSLMAAGQAMLEELQVPLLSYDIGFQEVSTAEFDKAAIGKRVRIVYPEISESVDTFVTEIDRKYDDPERSTIKVANKSTSIASTVADMADRQRIEQTYAQGATQIYSQALQANCDSVNGAVMDFFIPSEMRIVNKVLCKIRIGQFRAYSSTTTTDEAKTQTSTTEETKTVASKGGGKITRTTTSTEKTEYTSKDGGKSTNTTTEQEQQKQTSTAGGAILQTTGAGGGVNVTSEGGGGFNVTSEGGGGFNVTSEGGGATTATSSSGGGSTATSSSGGGSTATSSSGGGATATSNSGGGTTTTSSSGGGTTTDTGTSGINVKYEMHDTTTTNEHKHQINQVISHQHRVTINNHTHSVTVSAHTHSVTIPAHTHSVTIPAHTHSVTIPAHTHSVSIPSHTHTVKAENHTHTVKVENHTHNVKSENHTHSIKVESHSHDVTIPAHKHQVTIPDHNHKVDIPGHNHEVDIPDHTHDVTIPSHKHQVTIPAHKHNITPGIYKFGNPQSFRLFVGGAQKQVFSGTTAELDITSYLVGSRNMIPRGTWMSLEVRPDDLAYVSIDLVVQGFVQSRGDKTV